MPDQYDIPESNRGMHFDNMVFMPDTLNNRSRPRTPSSTTGTRISGSVSSIDGHVQYADVIQFQNNLNQINHIRQRSHQEGGNMPQFVIDRPASSQSAPMVGPQMHRPNGNPRGNRFAYSPKTLPAGLTKRQYEYRQRSESQPRFNFSSHENDESHYTMPNDQELEKLRTARRLGVSDTDIDINHTVSPSSKGSPTYLSPSTSEQNSSGEQYTQHIPVLYNPESKVTYLTCKDFQNIADEEEDAVDCCVDDDSASGSYTDPTQPTQPSGPEQLPSPPSSGGSIVSPSDTEVMRINFPNPNSNNMTRDKMKEFNGDLRVSTERQNKENNHTNLEKNKAGHVPDLIKHGFFEEGEVIVI